ncbi:MAG: trypsin-like peptidase domain-containing protein [Pseudomonadota bacterium]
MRQLILAAVMWTLAAVGASAQGNSQGNVWIQLEAQPSLTAAESAVRSYAARLPDVAGFQLSARWYGVALGPYSRVDAEQRLATLRGQGAVPRDAFVVEQTSFQRQFWPIGANALAGGTQPVVPATQSTTSFIPPTPEPVDETPRQARASENLLSRDQKRLLQIALQAEGYYTGAIDGLFGRGTRGSMSSWQRDKGFEATGVLTTLQRAALIDTYNSILDGLGLRYTADVAAGIGMQMPMDQLRFDEYEAPFAHYVTDGDLGIRLSLISQEGSRARFQGLYNVLQTLDAVPLDGPRSITGDRFQITGIDGEKHTTIDVRYANGVMKGFMLVWVPNDETRLRRVLAEMRGSLTILPGALDPSLSPPDESQSIDLLAGLEIRQPRAASTGFFVDGRGTVLTAAEGLGSCERVSIGDETDADIVFADAALGLALLRPQQSIAPLDFAKFQAAVPRLRDEVAVAGFSYGGDLGAPTLTLGELADLRGLEGDDTVKRLVLKAEPGDSGGPVFDQGGAVLGLLRPAPEVDGQILPETVRFAVDADTIRSRLADEGVTISEVRLASAMDPVELAALAADIAVLVECW